MNPYLAVAALISMASLMLMLPLVPALVELRRKSDAQPLTVVQQHAGEIRHFANSFRDYIKGLEPVLQRCTATGDTATGKLPDGEEYIVLGKVDEPLMLALQRRDASHPVVIAAGVDLAVPPGTTFSRDIYAGGRFEGGGKNNYRAILGEKAVHLGASSLVRRWVHAVGEFTAGRSCRLLGRVSSDSFIGLRAGCSFLRLNAPRIGLGLAAVNTDTMPPNPTAPANVGSGTLPRFLHDGDFEIRSGECVNGNIVVRGKLRIRAGARICGSVKSVKDMVLEEAVAVEGSLISARTMRVGRHCAIHGPVVAERELAIATGARCGTPERPTTVSAPRIEAEEGALVFGTLWARELGQVVTGK